MVAMGIGSDGFTAHLSGNRTAMLSFFGIDRARFNNVTNATVTNKVMIEAWRLRVML